MAHFSAFVRSLPAASCCQPQLWGRRNLPDIAGPPPGSAKPGLGRPTPRFMPGEQATLCSCGKVQPLRKEPSLGRPRVWRCREANKDSIRWRRFMGPKVHLRASLGEDGSAPGGGRPGHPFVPPYSVAPDAMRPAEVLAHLPLPLAVNKA